MTDLLDRLLEPAATLAGRIGSDPARPRFHFTAPTGWLNDPNGFFQWDGVHHLFYQCNPNGGFHHRIHWGHATSRDLVHWTDQPMALRPGDGPDADGCWSGVMVNDDGTPTIVYSGAVGSETLPCLATGSADLTTWTKSPGNPVITEPPAAEMAGFRDHCVWREGDRWRMLIGAGKTVWGGFIALYESLDLTSWNYLGPLLSGTAFDRTPDDPLWPGTMWECAELFRLEADQDLPLDGSRTGSDFLVFSAWHQGTTRHALYWSGGYRENQFVPTGLHRLDLGGNYFYAPQSYRDETGRRIMFGWLQDARSFEKSVAAGWAGVMSLPRLVTERGDGTLHLSPVPEVAQLRERLLADTSRLTEPGSLLGFDQVRGDQLDLELSLALKPGSGLEILLPGERVEVGTAAAVIRLVRTGRNLLQLQLDRSAVTRTPGIDTGLRGGAVPVDDAGGIDLRIIVDHSVLEIFANGVPLSARLHVEGNGQPLGVRAIGQPSTIRLRAWRMADAWPSDRP